MRLGRGGWGITPHEDSGWQPSHEGHREGIGVSKETQTGTVWPFFGSCVHGGGKETGRRDPVRSRFEADTAGGSRQTQKGSLKQCSQEIQGSKYFFGPQDRSSVHCQDNGLLPHCRGKRPYTRRSGLCIKASHPKCSVISLTGLRQKKV